MEKKQNKYSIRKFSVGASSILIGALLFLGAGTAQAAEEMRIDDAPTLNFLILYLFCFFSILDTS